MYPWDSKYKKHIRGIVNAESMRGIVNIRGIVKGNRGIVKIMRGIVNIF